MKKLLRLAVFVMCIAWLFSLLGCGRRKPQILDGPDMERRIWSAFTMTRCDERFEPVYSYTVKYDADSDKAYLYVGQDEENCVTLRQETVTELMNLNLLSLPDEEPLDGNFLGLSVFDSTGQAYPKRTSSALEDEILAILSTCLDELKTDGGEMPTMLDGPEMYKSPWSAFSISRTDSNTRYCFWFEVTETDDGAVVIGSCQDDNGMCYETEIGIPISGEDLWALRWMDLEQLQNVVETETWEELPQVLDGSNVTFSIVLTDGTVEKKHISAELSLEIYQQLLPYFINNKQ